MTISSLLYLKLDSSHCQVLGGGGVATKIHILPACFFLKMNVLWMINSWSFFWQGVGDSDKKLFVIVIKNKNTQKQYASE